MSAPLLLVAIWGLWIHFFLRKLTHTHLFTHHRWANTPFNSSQVSIHILGWQPHIFTHHRLATTPFYSSQVGNHTFLLITGWHTHLFTHHRWTHTPCYSSQVGRRTTSKETCRENYIFIYRFVNFLLSCLNVCCLRLCYLNVQLYFVYVYIFFTSPPSFNTFYVQHKQSDLPPLRQP